jgi:hypothetical protein
VRMRRRRALARYAGLMVVMRGAALTALLGLLSAANATQQPHVRRPSQASHPCISNPP